MRFKVLVIMYYQCVKDLGQGKVVVIYRHILIIFTLHLLMVCINVFNVCVLLCMCVYESCAIC